MSPTSSAFVGGPHGWETVSAIKLWCARPLRDFPMLVGAYLDGLLKLDELITARIRLEEINHGFEDLRGGRSVRTVIQF